MKSSLVAILDDHPLIGIGTSNLINQFEGFKVVYSSTSPVEFITWIELNGEEVDIFILDIHIPSFNVKDTIKHCLKFHPTSKILIYSSTDNPKEVAELLPYKIHGFIRKSSDDEQLLDALNKIKSNGTFFDKDFSSQIISSAFASGKSNDRISVLSKREKEILKYIASGLSTIAISEKIFLSKRTVDTHRYNILKKLEVKNAAGAVKLYLKSDSI